MPRRSTPPSKLYRYTQFTTSLFNGFLAGKVFYGPYSKFNDPFDCDLHITEGSKNCFQRLKDLRYPMASEAGIKLDELFDAVSPYEIETGEPEENDITWKVLLGVLQNYLRKTMSRYGVICFSEDYKSTLMWSHYAESHKGICLEFEYQAPNPDEDFPELNKIDYSSPNQIDAEEFCKAWEYLPDPDPDPEDELRREEEERTGISTPIRITDRNWPVFEAFYFRKSLDWSYEKEWRMVRSAIGFGPPPGPLTGIYFGLKCPDLTIAIVIKFFTAGASGTSSVKFYKMQSSVAGLTATPVEISRYRDWTLMGLKPPVH